MKLSREDATLIAYCPKGDGPRRASLPFDVVENRDYDERRWMMVMELVIRDDEGQLWRAFYERGLTEYQDERPFEDDGDEVEFALVTRRVVETYIYEEA